MARIAANLPPGARVWQAMMSDAAWTSTDYLLAELVDAININTWVTGNRGSDSPSPEPERMKRPADQRAEREAGERRLSRARAMQELLNKRKAGQ